MAERVDIQDITAGYRTIVNGRQYNRFFATPEENDRIILDDGDVDDTVELMKKVVWKYINDTTLIAKELQGKSTVQTCNNIWNFLFNHIQYRLDKKGIEQLRRPCRSWAEREQGIDCDCFSIFVSSILTNLQIPHKFRITKYGSSDVFQHVYVIVPYQNSQLTIDCVLNRFNYEKPYSQKKDFTMNLSGINVAVLSGIDGDVFDLVSGFEGLGDLASPENDRAIYEHLVKTRTMIAQNPNSVSTVEYTPAFLKMLDYAIENWNTPNRAAALEVLAKNEDALNRLNGIDEYDLDGIDDDDQFGAAKKSAPKKAFFKKVGEAAKKGGKAFIRFNPLVMTSRGGFLLFLKLNIKKVSSRLQWAYKTKEEAAKNGVSEKAWNNARNGLKKLEKLFIKTLQGKPEAMKKAIMNARKGGVHGVDDENEFAGLGVVTAAALASAVPVITQALKALVESGVMKKEEAEGLEKEIASQTANVSEEDLKEFQETQASSSATGFTSSTASASSGSGTDEENGLMAFVKKQPLVAVGVAGLGIWGLTKLMGSKKSASKGVAGIREKHKPKAKAKAKPKAKQNNKKIKAVQFK